MRYFAASFLVVFVTCQLRPSDDERFSPLASAIVLAGIVAGSDSSTCPRGTSGQEDTACWNKVFHTTDVLQDQATALAADSAGNLFIGGLGVTGGNTYFWIRKYSANGQEDKTWDNRL